MITAQQIALAKILLSTNLVDEVYHSVTLHADDKGDKYPVYAKGGEEYYIGPTDKKKRFAYIRQTGPVMKGQEQKEGSEKKMYRLSSANRIVVFNRSEKEDFDSLIKKLLRPCFNEDVSLISYQHNPFQLAKQESPVGEFVFDATTFYLAIDVTLSWWVDEKDCDDSACIVNPNPICL